MIVISEVAVDPSDASRQPANRVANVAESMRASSVVFPDEPVGVGATWDVMSRMTISGIMWDRKTTYILRALDDSTASVDASVVMRASSQALRVEPNASTRLTSATASSSAELTVPLRGLVTTGASRGTSEANIAAAVPTPPAP